MSESDLPEESTRSGREAERPTPSAPRTRRFGLGGPIQFIRDVQLEMRRVSWPSRAEVLSTTVICMIAVAFFGFYLWGVDSILGLIFSTLEGWLKQ